MTTTAMLGEDFGRAFITLTHSTLNDAAEALGDLDRRAGDGDFGTNVRVAMKGAAKNIETDSPGTYRQWLTAMYMGWLGVGGTSGPLFGMFFRDLAKAAVSDEADGDAAAQDTSGKDTAGQDATPSLAQFAQALANGQATVQKYGEAKVGDKTMIDALAPAVEALQEAARAEDGDAAAALGRAEDAAIAGARETAQSTARRGRASYVGDAAKGVIDPGAAAMALVIGAARAAAAGEQSVDTSWIS